MRPSGRAAVCSVCSIAPTDVGSRTAITHWFPNSSLGTSGVNLTVTDNYSLTNPGTTALVGWRVVLSWVRIFEGPMKNVWKSSTTRL